LHCNYIVICNFHFKPIHALLKAHSAYIFNAKSMKCIISLSVQHKCSKLYVGHTQGSTIVATAGCILNFNLVTILSVRTQHHKLEHMVYIFSQVDYH
jgi:hypothetical protein